MAKIKLVEKIGINVPIENIKVFDKVKIVEAAGKNYEAIAVIEKVPFTRFGSVNDNNRYYPRKLWEKVIKEGVCEGSSLYTNHAENETDVSKKAGIWHNAFIDDKNKVCRADLYLIGPNGQLFLDALKAGSKGEGISSVGYGEFEDRYEELKEFGNIGHDVKVVRWDTYDGESYGDWVHQPSQNVFATLENIKENNENSSNLNESYTNNSKATNDKLDENIKLQENKKEVYMDKSILKNMVLNEIKRSKNNPNLLEAIQGLKEIDTAGDSELNNRVNDAIETLTTKLEESKSNAEKQLNESTTKLNEMTAKYNKLVENYKKATSKVVELTESTKLMESDIKCLVEDSNLRDNDIKCLTEDRKVMISDLKKMIEDRKAMRKDINVLTTKLKEAEEVIGQQEDELEKRGFEFEEDDEEVEFDAEGNPIVKEPVTEEEMPAPEVLPETPAEIKEEGDEQELPMQIDPLPTEPAMVEEEDEMMNLDFEDEEEVEELEEEDAFDAFAPAGEEMDEPMVEEDEMEMPVEEMPVEEAPAEEVKEEEMPAPETLDTPPAPAPAPIAIEEPKPEETKMVEEDEEEKEDEEEVEEPEEEKEEMKESVIKFSWEPKKEVKKAPVKTKIVENNIKADLKKFYESQIAKNPSVKAIEKQIMSAKSLLEAFDMVDVFKSRKSDKLVKVTESKKSDGNVIKFKF
jgi:hypothetical protein